jgi:hypothetical protein
VISGRIANSPLRGRALLVCVLLAGVATPASGADEPEDFMRPSGHFRLANPATLSKQDAERAYAGVSDVMARAYARSSEPAAARYRHWQRLNDAPYLSGPHGDRYANSYANDRAIVAGYGSATAGIVMPPGAIIAKDSFTAKQDGGVFPGALFMMEKLEAGRSPATNDWRYVLVLPDGSVFGDSRTETAPRVDFCHACHRQQTDTDYVFGVPAAYRIAPPPP